MSEFSLYTIPLTSEQITKIYNKSRGHNYLYNLEGEDFKDDLKLMFALTTNLIMKVIILVFIMVAKGKRNSTRHCDTQLGRYTPWFSTYSN